MVGQDRHACTKATRCYGEVLAIFLITSGLAVSVVNPLRINGFDESVMASNNTDKLDAKSIARSARRMSLCPGSHPATKSVRLPLVWRYDDL